MNKLIDTRFAQVYCTDCRHWNKLLNSIENDLDCPKPCNVCYPYNPEDSTTPQYIKGKEIIRHIDSDNNVHEYECTIDFAKGEDKTVYITLKNGSVIGIIPCEDNSTIRGKRSEMLFFADKLYDKYLKRVANRKKLYEKLKKLGR